MAHPYQCLLYCHRSDQPISQILIAASGSYVLTFDVSNGGHLSSWPFVSDSASHFERKEVVRSVHAEGTPREDRKETSQPPSKRRKTSPRAVISTESSSAEIVVESNGEAKELHSNPVIKLAATSGGHYVVAVTSEDKCMRVFELSADGAMHQISERIMPKRPCAVILTPDDSTILCADKFGDVYSLPLLGKPYESKDTNSNLIEATADKAVKIVPQRFVPSATSLTVHTKRNREALKQQQNLTQKKPEKKSLTFDHHLLLGHVSLLTDVICTSISTNAFKRREYILTSDRDEHIRVSRSIPQTHIIEGYCLGHTQFISRLCLIPSKPELLISGGGDDFLLLWDWRAGTIKQRFELREVIEGFKKLYSADKGLEISDKAQAKASAEGDDDRLNFAVSNIQILEVQGNQAHENRTEVVITCETIPALLLCTFNKCNEIEFREAYPTEGNVIDIVILQDRGSVIYSMDNVHKPFSSTKADVDNTPRSLVKAIHFLRGSQRWEEDLDLDDALLPALEDCAKSRPLVPQKITGKRKPLNELLYSLESLRKRAGADTGAEDAADHEGAG